jgi:hypothetical protein
MTSSKTSCWVSLGVTERARDFRPNPSLTELADELNRLLGRAEDEELGSLRLEPHLPVVFIIGAPRSGTTLLLQWLANTGHFAYPTNLLSRFYGAPYVGSRIQQILTDPAYDYAGELTGEGPSEIGWSSRAGKTVGLLAPHEFSFLWRRFYAIDQARPLSAAELLHADGPGFANAVALIQRAFNKPFAGKGILLQYNLSHLVDLFPRCILIHTVREPHSNVLSLMDARSQVAGDPTRWFSVEPPGTEWLRDQEPLLQAAGQVHFTNASIERQLARIEPERWMRITHEDFCAAPGAAYGTLAQRLTLAGYELAPQYKGPAVFRLSNRWAKSGQHDEVSAALAAAMRAWTEQGSEWAKQ